ncbi:hypothetical protein B0T16DRAFT_499428, partial [Cercophora newfieldiana]
MLNVVNSDRNHAALQFLTISAKDTITARTMCDCTQVAAHLLLGCRSPTVHSENIPADTFAGSHPNKWCKDYTLTHRRCQIRTEELCGECKPKTYPPMGEHDQSVGEAP